MAGSYSHVTRSDGMFTSDFNCFTDTIENLGDAYEACEEMHWMIRYLSGGDQTKITAAHEAGVAVHFKET